MSTVLANVSSSRGRLLESLSNWGGHAVGRTGIGRTERLQSGDARLSAGLLSSLLNASHHDAAQQIGRDMDTSIDDQDCTFLPAERISVVEGRVCRCSKMGTPG